MSFGFSVSDIIKGLDLCMKFKELCLTEANRVDVQCKELVRDVGFLEDRLNRLKSAFTEISYRTFTAPLPSICDDNEEAKKTITLLKEESEALIGDFKATLKDCNSFLEENKKYLTRHANMGENFFQGRGVQSRVNNLRSRILFHMHKIDVILAPLQLELLAVIHDRVGEAINRLDEILNLLKGQPHISSPPFPEIPVSLSAKFEAALQKDQPRSYVNPDRIPLKEGFDALYEHYRDSTLQFKNAEISPQTLEQYLSLLKAHWLLEALKRSNSFVEARSGSLYRIAISQIEQRIAKQYARCDESIPEQERVIRFGEQELIGLEDAAFSIWTTPPKALRLTPTVPDVREEEMLRLPLAEHDVNETRELIFFRVGPTVIRLVDTSSRTVNDPASEGLNTVNSQYWINIHQDGLVPWYAIREPTSGSGKFDIELTNSRGAGAMSYSLESLKDALRFQRAITGYLVAPPPTENVRCSYMLQAKRFGFFWRSFEQQDGTGKVQIWNYSPLPATSNQPHSPTLSQSSSDRRQSVLSNTVRSRHPSLANSLGGATVSVTEETATRIVSAPKITYPSALVAFTISDDIYTIWYTELEPGMAITETIRDRARIVIRHKPKGSAEKTFTTRRISVPKSRLADCNLAVFGRPRHPSYSDQTIIKELSCDFLSLKFSSAKKMDDFADHFNFAIEIERERANSIHIADQTAEHLANRPSIAVN
ncbi:hypothetical protein K432DRAFT_403375 [Lepidopterella palustris CBS 459.81]|uniref:Uncharacterized protein n=1 Tax=Lepidopterella palustris CBS 459.81 TaxID=1314670 RepID=A0A8E2JGM6_9PEZI|nr:hypothetical protein K432DRAFT_403375 [Lepidopterella palustris CBS 459.81]